MVMPHIYILLKETVYKASILDVIVRGQMKDKVRGKRMAALTN